MNNPIIAIEGLSFSGKTTLCNILKEKGFENVKELAELCNGGKNFPDFPMNSNEAIKNDNWFQKIEEIRCKDALNKQANKSVVADRWFISSTGYIFARDILLGYDTLESHIEGIKEGMNKGVFFIPYFVYLDVDLNTIKKRHDVGREQYGGRELKGSLMVEPYIDNFFKLQKIFYDTFSLFYSSRVLILNDCNNKNISYLITWSNTIDSTVIYSTEDYERLGADLISRRTNIRDRGFNG